MPSLFISYRRADSPDAVKLMHMKLSERLPRWEIFYDHESIPLGDPFPERLRTKVTTATAVLVIVGPKWLEILHERKNAPIDHTREEVRLALGAGASVVPVLVGHARMPTSADLADFLDLQPLLQRNGAPVRPDPDFDGDLEPIIAHLKSLDSAEAVGTILDDKYTLTQYIDEGGMGVVYAAQQKKPVQRMVAVKLIKPGMDSRDVLARFDAERQALAVMDHPNVAKVLDAGLTGHGRPYFVMEYVKGVPITQYCDDRKLNPQERLNLFIPVCNAVQHAHQKGIIHRDLKPSNVLVEVVDGKPVPKVIDFGLAKALGQKLTDKTLHTALEMRVGTLEYSAPEQAAGRSFDVDTRSDIYSLGVLLYELLTGAPPFTHEELLKIGEEEMRRVIREVEPTTPSKKLSSSGALPALAIMRHLDPKKLVGTVQGDLDWIVMKCLEKENARRYETPNQLGQELQRFLADEPVQACPPSVSYRAGKFLRRNKAPVTAAMAIALVSLVAGGAVGYTHLRTRASELSRIILDSEIERVPEKINDLNFVYRWWANSLLREAKASGGGVKEEGRRLRASLALLPADNKQAEYLLERFLEEEGVESGEPLVILDALIPHLKEDGERAFMRLSAELDRISPPGSIREDEEKVGKRKVNAAIAMLRLGRTEKIWTLLRHGANPTIRSKLIHRLGPLGADPGIVAKRLEEETDVSIRRALTLSLGEFSDRAWPPTGAGRVEVEQRLKESYRAESDPGLHAATEWILRKWGHVNWLTKVNDEWKVDGLARTKRLQGIEREIAKKDGAASQYWYVDSEGHTMVLMPGAIDPNRRVAVANKLVTVEQFLRFDFGHAAKLNKRRVPKNDCPVNNINWHEAAAYCNWLNNAEGIEKDQWCYCPDADAGKMKLKDNYLNLRGYRLPTGAEMKFISRNGSMKSRFYGDAEELMGNYVWYDQNSRNQTHPVGSLKPSDFGLFDVHGNLWTWCEEAILVEGQEKRNFHGGSFGDSAEDIMPDLLKIREMPSRSDYVGFRVARTFTAK